jgi:hypothetical protein
MQTLKSSLFVLLVLVGPTALAGEAPATPCAFTVVEAPTAGKLAKKLNTVGEGMVPPGVIALAPVEHRGKLREAAVVSYVDEEEHWTRVLALALRHGDRWHVRTLVHEYNPGAFGIMEDVRVEPIEVRQLIPGGAPEVIVRTRHARSDRDMGVDEEERLSTEVVHIAGLVEGAPRMLLRVVTDRHYTRERTGLFSDEELKLSGVTVYEKLPIKKHSGVTLRFLPKTGEVQVEARKDVDPSMTPGTYPLSKFPHRCK